MLHYYFTSYLTDILNALRIRTGSEGTFNLFKNFTESPIEAMNIHEL